MGEALKNAESLQDSGSSPEAKGEALKRETKAKLENLGNDSREDPQVREMASKLALRIDALPAGSATLKEVNEKLWNLEGTNDRIDREKFLAFAQFLGGNLS